MSTSQDISGSDYLSELIKSVMSPSEAPPEAERKSIPENEKSLSPQADLISSVLGNPELLASEFAKKGLRYVEIGDVSTDSGKVSTTAIKKCLSDGKLKEATAMLGSPYFIRSYVEHGRGVGKTLGFPTLNTDLGGRVAFLKNGVYKTETEIDGKRYSSLTNVGICPTFESRPAHAETFIIDFDGDLYGSAVKIYFHSFIREEQKFSSPDELIKRINKDIEIAKGE